MADKYLTVGGFVQFDPNTRDHNGKTLQDVLIQNLSGNLDIRVTVWPEQTDLEIEKGDLIFANGKYTTRDANGKTYHNLSASKVKIFKADQVAGPSVVNALDDAPDAPEGEDNPF